MFVMKHHTALQALSGPQAQSQAPKDINAQIGWIGTGKGIGPSALGKRTKHNKPLNGCQKAEAAPVKSL